VAGQRWWRCPCWQSHAEAKDQSLQVLCGLERVRPLLAYRAVGLRCGDSHLLDREEEELIGLNLTDNELFLLTALA
jgi:hypothetical protein